MKKISKLALLLLLSCRGTLFAEDLSGVYLKAEPSLVTNVLGVGIYNNNHASNIFAGKSYETYRALGLEYSYHLEGVKNNGAYIRIFFERRWFNRGLETNSEYHPNENEESNLEDEGTWTHDTLNHHKADHVGLLGGYHWTFANSVFLNLALGMQHNNNPVNIGPTLFGIYQDVKSWKEARGEFSVGYFL